MGNAVAAKVAPWVRKEDTLTNLPPPRPVRPSQAPLRRLSFYAAKLITEDSMTQLDKDDPMAHLDWHAFLVHTDLCTMNYDCLGVDDDTRLRHLVRMVENLKVASVLNKAPGALLPFVYDIKQCMRANPYHGFSHITDVTQYMYTLLLATHVADALSPVERAAALVAAMCHDLDHPGLSNTFQNNENSELSQRYDRQSPLENHHLAVFEKLAEKHRLFDGMDVKDAARFREVVRGMVLATDMARHGALMERIKQKLAEPAWHPLQTPEGIDLVLQIALKCADISNQAPPWRVARKWNDAVYAEFYHEGDLDRERGRPVAPLLDRDKNVISRSTCGFIQFVVAPLYESYVAIMRRCAVLDAEVDCRAVEECLVFLRKNKEKYERQVKGEAVDPAEAEAELTIFSEASLRTAMEQRRSTLLPGVNGAYQQDARARLLDKIKQHSSAPAEVPAAPG